MKRVALIGYKGFVGRAIFEKLKQKKEYEVVGIGRETYDKNKREEFDIVINSAMSSRRFWALKNPLDDFDATVRFTAYIVYNWNCKKIVQISTVSARCQLDHPYGQNKRCAEVLVLNRSKNNLVFRLGGLYGKGLDKGAIFDILEGNKLFVSGDSKYNFISTKKAADIIVKKLDKSGIIEVGAKDQISLKKMASHFNIKADFGDRKESQHTENPEPYYPEAKEVLKFMEFVREKKGGE